MSTSIEKYANKPTDLSRVLQVIIAGQGRTGTVSLSLALEKLLNGPVCHNGSAMAFREVGFIRSWISILLPGPKTTTADIKATLAQLLAGYVATADLPANLYIEEIMELYPDVKVICNVRDPQKWWVSHREVARTFHPWWIDIVFAPIPVSWYRKKKDRGVAARMKILHPDVPEEVIRTIELQQIHNDYVRRVVPADRLLIYDIKDGWGPVCKFLDLPVPDEPFPHENSTKDLRAQVHAMVWVAAGRWAMILAGLGALSAIAIQTLRK